MPKNIVIIPLEGVSQTIFWQFRRSMPTLWDMSENAVMFRRFYSNSTSAFQSFVDFASGDSSELDHNIVFPSAPGCLLGRAENFFDILQKQNYEVMGIQHGGSCPAYVKNNFYGAWPESCGDFRWHDEYDAFYRESMGFIEKAKEEGKPFALYLSDRAGTVMDDCREKQESKLFHERFDKGYALLDQTVSTLMKKLKELSLLEDTIILVYGPYGMDPWKHGINGGRTHAIEPNADTSWTTMFLYNNGQDPKTVDQLGCVIDLKATVLGLLFPEQQFRHRTSIFSGINLLAEVRDVVLSQNMFALERENEGPSRGILKAYAATDGDQRLVVTSDGGIAGDGGMELFYDPRDSTSSRNLLDFFVMTDKGVLDRFGNPDATHPHFILAFHPEKPDWLIGSIVASYNAMREVLQKLVTTKEEEALQHCAAPDKAMRFKQTQFNFKRKFR